jgi:hypothetical protein
MTNNCLPDTTDIVDCQKYLPLTDAEWEAVRTIIAQVSKEGEVRRGRPSVNCRTLVDAITHAISFNIPIKWVGSSTMVYPSRPTLYRYYKMMVLSGVINQYVLRMACYRQDFLEQYLQYRHRVKGCPPPPPTREQLKVMLKPEPEPVRGRAGIISPVPWGPPGRPTQ